MRRRKSQYGINTLPLVRLFTLFPTQKDKSTVETL